MDDYWREQRIRAVNEGVVAHIVSICLRKLKADGYDYYCPELLYVDPVKTFRVGTFTPIKFYFELQIKDEKLNVVDMNGTIHESMVVNDKIVPHWDKMANNDSKKAAYLEMQPVIDMIKKWFDHFHSATRGPAADSALVWHAINQLSSALETLIEKNRF
jgi:hypothetical protein